MDLATDPTYLAYLRSIGFQGDTAQQGAALQTAQAQRRTDFQAPEIAFAGTIEREGIANGYDARGVYGSGRQLVDVARQLHTEQARQAALQLTQADTTTNIQTTLAQQLADLERQKAEKGVDIASQQYLQQALT